MKHWDFVSKSQETEAQAVKQVSSCHQIYLDKGLKSIGCFESSFGIGIMG